MKKQIAGLLTGLLVCSAFLTGCGKNEATEAVKESVEDENEGTGDTKDSDSKKDTNKKSDKQDSDKKDENSEESETTEEPEEDLDKIWVKFYKVDKARTREYGGSGIGLSIVKAIMDSLHQQCGVINHEDGVEFWMELSTK